METETEVNIRVLSKGTKAIEPPKTPMLPLLLTLANQSRTRGYTSFESFPFSCWSSSFSCCFIACLFEPTIKLNGFHSSNCCRDYNNDAKAAATTTTTTTMTTTTITITPESLSLYLNISLPLLVVLTAVAFFLVSLKLFSLNQDFPTTTTNNRGECTTFSL